MLRNRRRWIMILVAMLLAGVNAHAEGQAGQADDFILLRNLRRPDAFCRGMTLQGGYRGRALLLQPGVGLLFQTVSGDQCSIPWFHLLTAQGPSFPGLHLPPSDPAAGPRVILPHPSMLPFQPHMALVPLDEAFKEVFLRPSPGRAPLSVESAGRPLTIAVPAQNGYLGQERLVLGTRACQTPCTLHVAPGRFVVHTSSDSAVSKVYEVRVPPGGLRLRMRSSSASRYLAGLVLTAAGAALGISGATVLGFSTLLRGNTDRLTTQAISGTALGLGVALFIPGAILMGRYRAGIEWQRPLAVSVAPLPGGGEMAVLGRF